MRKQFPPHLALFVQEHHAVSFQPDATKVYTALDSSSSVLKLLYNSFVFSIMQERPPGDQNCKARCICWYSFGEVYSDLISVLSTTVTCFRLLVLNTNSARFCSRTCLSCLEWHEWKPYSFHIPSSSRDALCQGWGFHEVKPHCSHFSGCFSWLWHSHTCFFWSGFSQPTWNMTTTNNSMSNCNKLNCVVTSNSKCNVSDIIWKLLRVLL